MAEERTFEYRTVDAAFGALSEDVREHSIRTAEYAEIIFIEACAREMYADHYKSSNKLNPSMATVMKLAGMYHDIGKALVPEVYQRESEQFTKEETALYRKHTLDGGLLIKELFDDSDEYNKIEQAFLIEAASAHHENWDGTGYPGQTEGIEKHVAARITKVADVLDHLVMNIVSESPFEDAVKELKVMAGTSLDPEFVEATTLAKSKLKKIFLKYENKSRAVPETEQFVKRRVTRPVRQIYRPIMSRNSKQVIAYDSDIVYGAKGNQEPEAVEKVLRKKKLLYDLDKYRIYESLDTAKRFDTCGVQCRYIALRLTPTTYTKKEFILDLEQICEEELMEKSRLMLCISQDTLQKKTMALKTAIRQMKNKGFRIMGTEITREGMSLENLREMEINRVRLSPDVIGELVNPEYKGYIEELKKANIEILADGWEKIRHSTILNELEIDTVSGILAGDFRSEDDIVTEELAQR